MLKMKLNLQFFASGTITGKTVTSSSGTKLQAKIEWTSTKDDSNNSSTVTAKLYGKRADSLSGATSGKSWNGYITIDGTKSSFSSLSVSTSVSTSWVLMKTYTKTVTHDENGEKTITISGSLNGPSGTSLEDTTSTCSATVTLDKINRASALSDIEDFSLTDSIQIEITKYIDTYIDNLVITSGETVIKTINNIVSGASIEFTATEQELIKSLMTSPKLDLTFTLTTLNDTETIGTSIKTAKVSSFDRPVLYNVNKKENGHYQFAINGLIDKENDSPFQVYDDEGNLYDPTCYKNGDTYKIPANAYANVGGCMTASRGQIRFGIFVPKSLKNIKSITVDYAKLSIRNTAGSYILEMKEVTNYVSAQNEGENMIYLVYIPSSAMSGTNNTPVSVEINGLELTFNA